MGGFHVRALHSLNIQFGFIPNHCDMMGGCNGDGSAAWYLVVYFVISVVSLTVLVIVISGFVVMAFSAQWLLRRVERRRRGRRRQEPLAAAMPQSGQSSTWSSVGCSTFCRRQGAVSIFVSNLMRLLH